MRDMKIRHLLFDLDGTLLPMVQEEFVKYYMPLLAKAYLQAGVRVDPKEFIGAVWKGYEAMVKNDGSRTNREAFWSYMEDVLTIPTKEAEQLAIRFYSGDFNQAVAATRPSPLANRIVKTAKSKGIHVYLATNPVFPRCATQNRIRWAGLDPEDFELITTYEDCRFCKPNVAYFREILEQLRLSPEECLMVGNDVEEDLAIRSLGVKTFLVTDTMENRRGISYETDYEGSLEELLRFVEGLEDIS